MANTSMETGKHIKRCQRKNHAKNIGTEEFLQTANDADQTDLEAMCLTIAKQTSCIILLLKQCFSKYQINGYSLVMNQCPSEKKDKYRAPFQHFKLYNVKNEKT